MPYDPSMGLSPQELASILRKMQTQPIPSDFEGRTASIEAYEPTLEDSARSGLADMGVDPEQAGRAAAVVPFTPPGMAYEGGRQIGEGNYIEGGSNLALAAAPVVPGAAAVSLGLGAFDPLSKAIPQFGEDMQSVAGAFMTGAQAGEGTEEVKKLQIKMRDEGYYSGKIDGLMKEGTKAAKKAYEEDQMKRLNAETARQAAQAQAAKSEAERAETLRKAQEAVAKADQRKAGEERLRESEENVPWYRKAIRNYGPLAGLVGGIALGGVTKKGVNKISDKFSEKAANRANDIINAPARDTAAKVAKVNQFWAQGQKGGFSTPEAPFTANGPRAKNRFKINPDAPEASSLYQPSKVRDLSTDAGVATTFGVESGLGQFVIEPEARHELENAQKAVSEDPSEVNIERLQSAKDRVALAESVKNLGRGAAAGYLAGGIKYRRQPSRPDVAKAEAEKLRVEQSLGTKPKTKRKKAKFVAGVPGQPRSEMRAPTLAKALDAPATEWFKANPGKHLNGTHVKEMATAAGLDMSDKQAANVARRLRTSYDERYINAGAKAALTTKE